MSTKAIVTNITSFSSYVVRRLRYWLLNDYPLWYARIQGLSFATISRLVPWLNDSNPKQELCVKVICQVRADSDIIEDWILWHGYLFGLLNICVIADRPTPETANILSRYAQCITILQAPLGDWPSQLSWCEKKTYNLNHAIRTLAVNADFVFPLDSDEFIIFEDKPDKRLVLRELNRLQGTNVGGFKFGQEFQSCSLKTTSRPAIEINSFRKYSIDYDGKKCFAKSCDYTWVGAGQHYIYTRRKTQALVTRLSLLHFRWRGINHMYEKCLDHASQQVVLPDGTKTLPRLGDHVRFGAEAIEKGTFSAWATTTVGTPDKRITGLSQYLTHNQS